MHTKGFFTLAVAALVLVSCATQKQFTIRTTPVDGAIVHINGVRVEGTTPVTTEIKQDKDLGIVVTKDGYELASSTVYTQTNWWRSLLWTSHDPKARFIEEDEITVPLKKLQTISTYTPTKLPAFNPPPAAVQAAPTLHSLPQGL